MTISYTPDFAREDREHEADVAHLPTHVQLPMLASDPRVRTFDDLEVDRLESCAQCVIRSYAENWAEDKPIPVGRMRVTYHLHEGGSEHESDLCGPDCCDVELDEVLNMHSCVGVRLHIPPPSRFLSTVHPDDDGRVQELRALRQGIKRMRNDAQHMDGPGGFESAREKAVAYVEALVDDRIEQLRRTS